MPLLRLWKSLRSGSKDEASKTAAGDGSGGNEMATSAPTAGVQANENKRVPKKKQAKKKKLLGGILGAGPHGQLTRQLRKLEVQSILEVGVGDGTRALAIIESLQTGSEESPLKYVAIDQFEITGSIALRDFHSQLRALSVTANLIPMPPALGLDRVARTYGQMDLVLWADDTISLSEVALDRICKPDGAVFCCTDGQWLRYKEPVDNLRAA